MSVTFADGLWKRAGPCLPCTGVVRKRESTTILTCAFADLQESYDPVTKNR